MSLQQSYFDELYAASPDPWGFAVRLYEQRKYALTLAALPRERYRRAFEPGCSIGVLTKLLAERADVLLASDISPQAVAAACRARPPGNVELAVRTVPREWPAGRFDLIVFSELGYYFDRDDLDRFIEQATASLEPDGHLVAVHWRTPVADYPSDGPAVHARLCESRLRHLAHYEDVHFLLDVFGASREAQLLGPEDGALTQPKEQP
jgi:SAM-dependent methyltransferase